jgi:hypothetical protein
VTPIELGASGAGSAGQGGPVAADGGPPPAAVGPDLDLGLDLDAIEARADAATEGPWKVWVMSVLADPVGRSNLDDGLLIADTTDPHRGLRTFNAHFIAAARTDVPVLVAEVRRLRARCESLQAELTRLQRLHASAADRARQVAAALESHP